MSIPLVEVSDIAERDRTSSTLFKETIMRIPLIYEPIMSFLPPVALLRLSRVCKTARDAANDYIRRSFHINNRLAHFFDDPLSFRGLQARTGTLISGSFALHFFERVFDATIGLDLFVPMQYRREVGRWLINDGYQFIPAAHQNANFEVAIFNTISLATRSLHSLDGIASIMEFSKVLNKTDLRYVKLFIAESMPMEVILGSHSTCVMNAISFEAAYCLFPRATLEERITLVSSSTKGIYRSREKALRKYSGRGYNIALSVPSDDLTRDEPLFPMGWRWIDDNTSWVIPLDVSGIEGSSPSTIIPHDPVVVTNWHMRCSSRTRGVNMLLGIIKSHLLQHRYLITDQDLVAHIANFLALKYRTIEMSGEHGDTSALFDAELVAICRKFVRQMGARRFSCLRVAGA